MPKTEVPINIRSELMETFDSINEALCDACKLALKQPILGEQLVLMTDVSFRSASYALMIQDNPDQTYSRNGKPTTPWHLAQRISAPRNSRFL